MGLILVEFPCCKVIHKQEFHWIYSGENSLRLYRINFKMQSDFCEAWHLPSTNKGQKKQRRSFLIWIRCLSKECCSETIETSA